MQKTYNDLKEFAIITVSTTISLNLASTSMRIYYATAKPYINIGICMKVLLVQPPVQDFCDTDVRLQPIGLAYPKPP